MQSDWDSKIKDKAKSSITASKAQLSIPPFPQPLSPPLSQDGRPLPPPRQEGRRTYRSPLRDLHCLRYTPVLNLRCPRFVPLSVLSSSHTFASQLTEGSSEAVGCAPAHETASNECGAGESESGESSRQTTCGGGVGWGCEARTAEG